MSTKTLAVELNIVLPGVHSGRPSWSREARFLAISILQLQSQSVVSETAQSRGYKEDGLGFVGNARRQIWTLDTADGAWSQQTHEGVHCLDPQWSPTSDTVAFRLQDPADWPLAGLGESSLEDSSIRIHPTPEMSLDAFAWSPDGQRLMLAGDTATPWANHADIFVLDRDDGEMTRLTAETEWQPWVQGFHVSPSTPRWRSDDVLLVPAMQRGHSVLIEIDVARRDERVLASWRDVRGGGTWIGEDLFVQERSSLDSVGELVVHRISDASDQIIATPNADVLDARLSSLQVIRSSIVRGGHTIDVWVLLPDTTSADPLPLVLDIHGGPHNFYGEVFIPEQQALLSAGIAVAFANPRGSASYGREFALGTHAAWGLEDTEDLWAAVHLAASLPQVNSELVGVMGWSYGGYQVAWMLAHSDRFVAGVCGAPAFDLASWIGTSDLGRSFARHEMGGRPPEAPDRYHMQSPSTHAHRIRTPTLILHGKEDLRSPVGQTEMMFDILGANDCRAEYRRYPGASHAFRHTGVPSQRIDVVSRTVAWFLEEFRAACAQPPTSDRMFDRDASHD